MLSRMTETNSRQAIMDCARDLLIRHGYRGASFGDIATALGMTRANIHYHFGSKQGLVEDVLAEYVEATLSALRVIWLDRQSGFADRVERMLLFGLKRYRRYRTAGQWSLISRLRQDADLLTAQGREMLEKFSTDLRTLLAESLAADVEAGNFASDMPISTIAAQLALIADNASAITMDADGEGNLVGLYRGLVAIVERGYGREHDRRRQEK